MILARKSSYYDTRRKPPVGMQMPLLLAVMLITMIYSVNGSLQSRRGKYACVMVITLFLTLFSGLRSWWMGDLIKYYTLFRNCNGPEWASYVFEDSTNFGIRIFFRVIGGMGMPYEVAIFLIAAMSAYVLGKLVQRYSPSPFWSYVMWISMGFYLFTYSGLKQTIAMAFLMLAMVGLLENRFKNYLLWTLIAGCFHAPALIFLLAYPFARMRFSRSYLLIVVTFVALVFLFRTPIVSFMSELYYDDTESLVAAKTVGGRFLMMAFILVVGMILRPLQRGDMVYNKVFNIMVIALALQMFSVFDNNFTRLADYYYQFIVLFMPLMLQNTANKTYVRAVPGQGKRAFTFTASTYTLVYFGITAFALYYYNSLINNSWAILNDFKFIWEIDPYSFYGA